MAATDVRFVLEIDDQGFIRKLENFERALESLQRTTQRTGGSVKAFGQEFMTRLVPAFTAGQLAADGIRKAFGFFKNQIDDTIAAAIEAEKVDRALEATLSLVGDTTGATAERLKAYAAALQRKTIYDDEAIKSAQALIVQMRGTADQVDEATKGAIGLASVFKMDLQSAAQAVAQGFEGNYRQLGMLIPAIRTAQTESEKHAAFMKAMADGYVRAEAEAGTFYGRLADLKKAYGELQETIGGWVTKNTEVIATLGGVKEILIWLDRWAASQKDKPEIAKWWNWTAPGALMLSIRKLGKEAKVANEQFDAWPDLLAEITRAAEDATGGLDDVAVKLNLITELRYQKWLKSLKPLDLSLIEVEPGSLFPEGGPFDVPPFLQALIDQANEAQKRFKDMGRTWSRTVDSMTAYSNAFFDDVYLGWANTIMNFRLSTEGFKSFFIESWEAIKRAFFKILGEMVAAWAVTSFVRLLFPLSPIVPSFVGGILPGAPPFIPAQHGFNGVVTQPTIFLAGERAPERVSIQPTSGRGGGASIVNNFYLQATDATGIESLVRHRIVPILQEVMEHGDL